MARDGKGLFTWLACVSLTSVVVLLFISPAVSIYVAERVEGWTVPQLPLEVSPSSYPPTSCYSQGSFDSPSISTSKIDDTLLELGEVIETRIVVEVDGEGEEYIGQLSILGLKYETCAGGLVQGLATPQDICEIAAKKFVSFIRPPIKPVFQKFETEGLEVIKADLAHLWDVSGSGVKVAVIDSGFDVGNEEISSSIVEWKSFRADGDITGGGEESMNHGTAVAEIIVDIAPQVELYLYNVDTSVEFINAVDRATQRSVHIIQASISFCNVGPYDGTSDVSQALSRAREHGILPVVSAGNSAQGHWRGKFRDGDGDGWHEFPDGTEALAIKKREKDWTIYLSWNDWPRSSQDFDLYICYEDPYSGKEKVFSSSTKRQYGIKPPTEEISGEHQSLHEKLNWKPHIKIKKFKANADVEFELFASSMELEKPVPSGSIPHLADARGALAVGATYWSNDELEPFSSRGPTVDGRIKPDVVAPDGVRTSTYPNRFGGTSASAPHVAGAAALLFSVNPSLGVDDVQMILEEGAVDLGDPGKDNLYGAGRIQIQLALLDVVPPVSPLTVDEVKYDPPDLAKAFVWRKGSTHTISVQASIQPGEQTRYRFDGWSDGATDTTRSITYPGGPKVFIASFVTQHYLEVSSEYGSSSGSGWYDEGTVATFSVEPFIDHGNRTRTAFMRWMGDSDATTPTATLVMDNPNTVEAKWETQYLLEVESPYSEPIGGGWYDRDSTATISLAETTFEHNNFARRIFERWTGDIEESDSSFELRVNAPYTVVALWNIQYYLTVDSVYGEPSGEGWYDTGSTAAFTVNSPIDHGNGTRRVFVRWKGDTSSADTAASIVVDSPKRVSAEWKKQYYLTVESNGEEISGSGWYDSLSHAHIVAKPPRELADGSQLTFSGWSGDIESSDPEARLSVEHPATLKANWKIQHYLEVVSEFGSPSGSGWYDEGSTAIFSVNSPQGFLVQQAFENWIGDSSSTSPKASIIMDSPKKVEAIWRRDYTQLLVLLIGLSALTTACAFYAKRMKQKIDRPMKIDQFNDVALICPHCREKIFEETIYCPHCGQKITD